MLRREGHKDNVKRVYRLYREEGLSLRLKRPSRNKAAKLRQPKQLAFAINEIWSMDFVADALFDGRKLRMLTVVDCYTRECLAIDVGQSLKGEDVVRTLNRICRTPRSARHDQDRQRQRVHLQGDGQMGLRARCRRASARCLHGRGRLRLGRRAAQRARQVDEAQHAGPEGVPEDNEVGCGTHKDKDYETKAGRLGIWPDEPTYCQDGHPHGDAASQCRPERVEPVAKPNLDGAKAIEELRNVH